MVDWDHMRDLREEIGEAEYEEVVALFFEEAEEAVGRLSRPATARAREADMHFLKGCALNLGFSRLGAVCGRGEERAAAGTLQDDDVLAVIVCYQASRRAFESERVTA